MASVDIWKNAPSTIRQHSQQEASKRPKDKPTEQPYTASRTQPTTPPRHYDNTQLPRTPQSDNLSATSRPTQPDTRHAARPIDNNTVTTAFSNTTTINSSNATKIAELEQAIKTSQKDFQQMHTRFDNMETQIINTMTSCHDNSKHILSMQSQLNSMQSNVQDMANQMTLLTSHLKITPTPQSDATTTTSDARTMQSPEKKKQRQTMEPEENMSLALTRPLNLENRYTPTATENNYYTADQNEVQYNKAHFSGTAMEE